MAMTPDGIPTAPLVAALGAAGLAIGLSLQGSLSNLAWGVLLVIFRPFRVGDFVTAGGIRWHGGQHQPDAHGADHA